MTTSCTCYELVPLCVSVRIPVVFVGEVVDNGGADAGHAPLAVVPSSCDDRELRSTQTLLTSCAEGGQRTSQRNVHSVKQPTHAESILEEELTHFL